MRPITSTLPAALCAALVIASALPAQDAPPKMTPLRTDVKPFKYVEAKVPFYPAGEKWGTLGKPLAKMQRPLEPDESQKHLVTPVELEPKLFAAEPLIKRPIAMNWDERGRLWIAESVDYPNELKPAGEGRDRIVTLEDTDNDGEADKVTVFADKLSIPTGFTFANGGVLVVQAPDTLFLKDTDGDGKADVREVLFTGWGTRDTHAGPSNLHWGFDNWVYGMVGYSGFEGTVGGEKHSFRQGFFRFKPDGSKLEFLRSTNNNSWGVGFSEEGVLFGSTANGNPSVYLPIPNRYYEAVRGWSSRVLGGIAGNAPMQPITKQVRQVDHHGHFTAAAGHALYTARAYPKQYWNRAAFVTEPTGHLVATFLIEPKGADYVSRNAWNLLASDDEWTSPIIAEVGPDGNVWVLDWYNYIVQHNPTPAGYRTGPGNAYETPLRDKTHGRVYRLAVRGAKPAAPLSLKDATPEQLVAALKNDNLFWRKHAQRLLVERGNTDVVPALLKLLADHSVDAIGLNPGAIHALWTLHGLGVLDGRHPEATDAAVTALRHKSAGVRRNALLTLPRDRDRRQAIFENHLLDDVDGQVRLAAHLALAEMPASPDAAAALTTLSLGDHNQFRDPWIADALIAAAAKHDHHFLGMAVRKPLTEVRQREIVAVVAEHYARGGPKDSIAGLLATLPDANRETAELVIAGLAKGWPKNARARLDANAEKLLVDLFPKLSTAGRGQLVRLASALGSKQLESQSAAVAQALLAVAADEDKPAAERVAAAKQAVASRPDDDATVTKLLDVLSPRTPPEVAVGLLDALTGSQAPRLGSALVRHFPTFTPQTRNAALRVLLSRPEATRAFLDAVDAGQAQLTDLSLDQKQALAVHPDRKLASRAKKLLARGGGLPSPDRQKVLEQLLPLARKTGDPAQGKLLFQKHCATCHLHGGEGNKVGPDLTGMAAHTKEHLLTDILDPSRSVEGNFRIYNVVTADGRVFNGLLASETKTAVELFDSQGKKHVLLREDIEQMVASNKSLMPEGFEKQLKTDELVDLLAFLTRPGRFVPLPLDKAATIVSTRGMFHSKDAEAERLVFPDWQPRTFNGVPFQLVDPRGGRVPNVVLLYGPSGKYPPTMPKAVKLESHLPAKAVHLLSGVSGWGYPSGKKGSVSLIVRLHYADGKTEDHPLRNGEHFADYIRRVDVPGSKFAFALRGQQMRYLAIEPKRSGPLRAIEFIKGNDTSAPVVMAVTVETRNE